MKPLPPENNGKITATNSTEMIVLPDHVIVAESRLLEEEQLASYPAYTVSPETETLLLQRAQDWDLNARKTLATAIQRSFAEARRLRQEAQV